MRTDGDVERLRLSYEAAWAERVRTGMSADEVLLRQFGEDGLDGLLDETSVAHAALLDLWRRSVPPERLRRELTKVGVRLSARAGLRLGAAAWAVAGSWRGPGAERPGAERPGAERGSDGSREDEGSGRDEGRDV